MEQAGSGAETKAIKNGDYSLTPYLQGIVVSDLAPAREKRRLRDAETRERMTSKTQKKRKGPQDDAAKREHRKKKKGQLIAV